ncbi:MAG: hypothetical protein FIA91_13110, partial [Geobacter sp.]|nr:hypothetical protein [Geobacter sp.]
MNFSGRISTFPAAFSRLYTCLILLTFYITATTNPAMAFPINGVCGSASGMDYSAPPATGLCSSGTPSTATGIGPWFWS